MSSLHCTQCQAPLDQDFGVISCGRCGAVLMVDIEGNIQLSEVSPASIAVSESPVASQDSEVFQSYEQLVPAEVASTAEVQSAVQAEAYEFENHAPAHEASIQSFENEYHQTFQEPEAQESAVSFKEEIIEFGNADLHSGPLSYTLTVSKIDSGELRGALRAILSDPKFGLDVDMLFGSIKAGRLSIESLNPIKTSLLVQKLRSHAFQISWRQHVFSV